MSNFKRYALTTLVGDPQAVVRQVEAYMPGNYTVTDPVEYDGRTVVVIEGRDSAGWTLDGYVIPRLASGLIFAKEIGLDHPVMKLIPEKRPA